MKKAVGEYYEAGRFVEITNAHVMGEHGLARLEKLVSLGTKRGVTTTTNARCFDFAHMDRLGQRPGRVERERYLISCLHALGVVTTDTCINYQVIYQPHAGGYVAWGTRGR